MKAATDTRNSRLRPNCPASQPVSGVMMAAATMYEVSTQVIWSWVADSEPCILGRATLAMVLSSVCRIEVSITVRVIMPRFRAGRPCAVVGDTPELTAPRATSRTGCGGSWYPHPRSR